MNRKQATIRHILGFLVIFNQALNIGLTRSAWGADFESPRIAGLGGAGRAAPILNDALFLNPSFGSFLNTYSISANYLLYTAGSRNAAGHMDYNGHLLNVSIQDGRSELFQAGIAGTRREDITLFHLSASKSLIPNQLSVGIHGKLGLPNDGTDQRIFDFGVSGTYVFAPWVQASLTLDNLQQTANERRRGFFREVALGTRFTFDGIGWLYLDPHWTPDLPANQIGFNLAAELPLLNDFFARVGKFNHSRVPSLNLVSSGYGFGLGWIAPKISFDYALQRAISPLSSTSHVFGVTIFF